MKVTRPIFLNELIQINNWFDDEWSMIKILPIIKANINIDKINDISLKPPFYGKSNFINPLSLNWRYFTLRNKIDDKIKGIISIFGINVDSFNFIDNLFKKDYQLSEKQKTNIFITPNIGNILKTKIYFATLLTDWNDNMCKEMILENISKICDILSPDILVIHINNKELPNNENIINDNNHRLCNIISVKRTNVERLTPNDERLNERSLKHL